MSENQITQEADIESRMYELGFLLVPTLSPEDVEKEVEALKSRISSVSGEFLSLGTPTLIDLSYEMDVVINNKKETFNQGYFGFIAFNMDPGAVVLLKKELNTRETFIRFLLIKTTEEAVSQNKNFGRQANQTKKSSKKNEESTEEVDEVIDEKIDAMVEA